MFPNPSVRSGVTVGTGGGRGKSGKRGGVEAILVRQGEFERKDDGSHARSGRLDGRWGHFARGFAGFPPKGVCKSVDKEGYARNGSKSRAARYSVNLFTLPARRRMVRLA